MKKEIVKRKSLQDKAFDYLTNLDFNTFKSMEDSQEDVQISGFWHYISSSWVFVILMIVMPFTALADKKNSLLYNMAMLTFLELFLYLLGLGLSKLTSYIPIFFPDKVWINYAMNSSLLTFTLIVPALVAVRKENKKKTYATHAASLA